MNILGLYQNGNYHVAIFDNGTKLRYNEEDSMTAEFPESIDCKICNRCDMNCEMCHERSTPDGALADLNNPVLDTLHPFTELAIGGGNPLEHPGLKEFLERMKEKKVICNLTVNLNHFRQYYNELLSLSTNELIHGLGISVQRLKNAHDVDFIKSFPHSVVHVIAGVVDMDTINQLANNNLNLLILGYKDFGRGKDYYNEYCKKVEYNSDMLKLKLAELRDTEAFEAICFDNLAIKQLDVRHLVSEQEWNDLYMGDDGQYTMYIDLVKNEYAVSSTSERHPIPAHASVGDLFRNVKEFGGQK